MEEILVEAIDPASLRTKFRLSLWRRWAAETADLRLVHGAMWKEDGQISRKLQVETVFGSIWDST